MMALACGAKAFWNASAVSNWRWHMATKLGGAPGVLSARYAGPTATSAERMAKLLAELRGKTGQERCAHFVCAIALARRGRATAVVTDRVDGEILQAVRGDGGFGYDPIFYFPPVGKTFAELSAKEKNECSHRGKAFRKVLDLIANRHPS